MITIRIKDGQLMGVYADPEDGLIGKRFAVIDHDIGSMDPEVDTLNLMLLPGGRKKRVAYFTSEIEARDFSIA
jgi:hypothetical protein